MAERKYIIRVKGLLDQCWSEWFDGLTISHDVERGETLLAGPVADETALYSLLMKARNLCLTLISVEMVEESVPPHQSKEEDSNAK
jgi:hypothetical protein